MAKIIVARDQQVLQEVELSAERMVLGRHAGNDIVIAHRAVSGQHAAFSRTPAGTCLEDLDSTNGTFVNGQRITRRMLADGDQIVVAKFQIAFIDGKPAAPEPVASIEVVGGANAGKRLVLSKAVSTLGRPGVQVAAITRQDGQFYLHHVDGATAPQVNRATLGQERRLLADGDCIDLIGASMVFRLHPG